MPCTLAYLQHPGKSLRNNKCVSQQLRGGICTNANEDDVLQTFGPNEGGLINQLCFVELADDSSIARNCQRKSNHESLLKTYICKPPFMTAV